MSFLLAEDEALRNLLKDMVVTDQKSVTEEGPQRKVGVWFGQPDQEVRSQSYPYITIDMIDIGEDFIRSMRGKAKPVYMTDPATGPDGSTSYDDQTQDWHINWPIPVNIDYQITTYARQPRHDRQILAQLLYTKIPLRFAVLETGPNTQSGTTRRLDVLDVSKRDITEQGKRLFVNAITVRVSSEIAPETFNKLYKVQELNVTGTTGSQTLGRGQFTAIDPITITAP
jgi:hypothetical protein